MTQGPAHWAGDVVLADGGTAHVRPIQPEDAPRLAALHARLSPESIYLRYFSPRPRLSERDLEHFTRVDHDRRVALVALLGEELIGVGRYDRRPRSDVAEVAFVVDDAQQGRGIATLLLERLAAVARERGVSRFAADVLPQNRAMLHVFHDAGFDVTSRFEDGIVRLSFPIERTPEAIRLSAERERVAQTRSIERLLAPRGIAVVAEGASCEAVGGALLESLAKGGHPGPVRRLAARAPKGAASGLDLVFLALPPELLAAQIERCARWGAHAIVLVAGGTPDDDAGTAAGDRALAARARRNGLRLLGPGSLGVVRTVPPVRLVGVPELDARIASGGLALFTESSRRGRDALAAVTSRGLGLSTFLSVGRKADVSANDALEFWAEDGATRVIGLALRSLGNPRRAVEVVRRVCRDKPVLIWLADPPVPPSEELARAFTAHTGAIGCSSLDDLLDVAEALLAPGEPPAGGHVGARIAAWERWRRARPEAGLRAEGLDRGAARCVVDALLGASPAGAALADDAAVRLLRCYGVTAVGLDAPHAAATRLRVAQDPFWGAFIARDGPRGRSVARLLPLLQRDARALVGAGPPGLRSERTELVRRVATLAADVPELAALVLELSPREGEPPALVHGSARLAPWTLGIAHSDAAAERRSR